MPLQTTLAQLIPACGADPINLADAIAAHTTRLTTDTRTLQPGDTFLALRGENFDGHTFVETAFERGAIAAIVDSRVELADLKSANFPSPCLLRVPDTLQAYQAIAHWWRNQFQLPVVAITGSVGKTTTKELIAAVLSAHSPLPTPHSPTVLKSQANHNNEIGVPKTLLELGAEHHYAVVEMGMRGRGQIALLSQIARPTVAVITNVGTAHIGLLGSEEAIAAAKCELLAEMPADSVAVLNHDNSLLMQTAKTVWQGKTVTFGLEGGDVHGQLLNSETLIVDGLELPLPLPGRHNALNYLAALAVAKVLGLTWESLKGVQVDLPGGRAKRYELSDDVVVLDETYNAGLESMLAALHLLAQTPGQRRIAVLGTMKELGDRSPEFHHQVGAAVQHLHLDYLLILADEPEAAAMKAGAGAIPTECLTNHADLVERLNALAQPGDRILLKASRAVGLDQVVEQFCQERSQLASTNGYGNSLLSAVQPG